jgi:hypothetical protein
MATKTPDVRGPRSEVRGPRPEVRGPRPEAQGPRPEVGDQSTLSEGGYGGAEGDGGDFRRMAGGRRWVAKPGLNSQDTTSNAQLKATIVGAPGVEPIHDG